MVIIEFTHSKSGNSVMKTQLPNDQMIYIKSGNNDTVGQAGELKKDDLFCHVNPRHVPSSGPKNYVYTVKSVSILED